MRESAGVFAEFPNGVGDHLPGDLFPLDPVRSAPEGRTDLLDPSRPAFGQHNDRPARLVDQRAPLPPIGNPQCPSVPPPAARWPHSLLIDGRDRKLYPGVPILYTGIR